MRACTILIGDALTRLKQIKTKSIHCIVTSVPYYGLRAYGTEPQVWGGEPDCQHLWAEQTDFRNSAKGNGGSSLICSATRGKRFDSSNAFCQRCGAWCGELGLEPTIELYIEHIVMVFAELKRVLRKDGTCWLNIGDSYAGSWSTQGHKETHAIISRNSIKNHPKRASHTGSIRSAGLKPKDLIMMPARIVLALQAKGWWIRADIIWNKNAPMPESVTDRPTVSYEHVFLLTKSSRYFFDAFAVRETSISDHPSGNGFARPQSLSRQNPDGTPRGNMNQWANVGDSRNLRSVWTIPAEPHSDCLCNACGRYYKNPRGLKREIVDIDAPARGPRGMGREEIGLRDSTKFGRGAGWREKAPDSWHGSHFDDGKNLAVHPNVGRRKPASWDSGEGSHNQIPEGNYTKERYGKIICECGASDWTQHFAAYPTALVDRCLRAGTSEKGVCPQCGAPWKRILKPSEAYAQHLGKDWSDPDRDNAEGRGKVISVGLRGTKRSEAVIADYSTVGWEQTCKCEVAEPIPATTLDPFAGMGTTGIASLRLNLSVIEIELQPQYARMAQIRTEQDAPLLNRIIVSQPEKPIPNIEIALA